MEINKKMKVELPKGKMGVLVVGINGAVATTFIAGTLAVRKGLNSPVGSLTQMGTIRIGNRSENNFPKIKDFVPLTPLNDIVFGGWDIRDENSYESILYAKVLDTRDLEGIEDELKQIKPMKAVFDSYYVKRLHSDWKKEGKTKYDLMMQLREDIRRFKSENNLDRMVTVWCGSTEIFIPETEVHQTLTAFEKGMKENHIEIAPSMLYAYASVAEGVPYINGAPNLSVDMPAIWELAAKNNVPLCGKDFKTGQTMIKTVLSPMIKSRMLGLDGWYSTNILGNRDGEVLDDPESFKTKEESKLSVIDSILQPELYPELYGDYDHKVRINYYKPRGDNKEGWDNIDIFGWMGYKMQLKVNFLCRDSILAAPLVLDLVLFMDLAKRVGFKGIQSWLSFYFKSPMHAQNVVPEHDLFIQSIKLKNTLREIMNEKPIDFLDEKIELFK